MATAKTPPADATGAGGTGDGAGAATGGEARSGSNREHTDRLAPALAATRRELEAVREARDLSRLRAGALQEEERRLRERIAEEHALRLKADQTRALAEAQLRRLQSGRWWRLRAALGDWGQRPWRIDRLARTCWALLTQPPRPSAADAATADNRQATVDATRRTGLERATHLYREGRYEAALDRLSDLPPPTSDRRGKPT